MTSDKRYEKKKDTERSNDKRYVRKDRVQSRKRVISAGFVVRSKGGKILLGQTTKYPKKQCWTVFKGQQEEGECLIATAVRELREESGIDILRSKELQMSHSTSPFFTFPMKDKDVILYLLNDDQGVLEEASFKCSSYWGANKAPEICDYKWVTYDEMAEMVFPSQRGLVECLKKSSL